jgi:hypothetical protein
MMPALREWLHPSKWEIIGNVEPWGRRAIYQVWRQLVAVVHGKKIGVLEYSGRWKKKCRREERRGEERPCDDVV